MGIKSVVLLPAREQVASALRDAILNGEFEENEAITLEEIANRMGVSKMPVREAFQILEREGLVTLQPNKGARVIGTTYDTIKNQYEVRAALETEVVHLICEKEDFDFRAIDELNDLFEVTIDNTTGAFSQADYNLQFHGALWKDCGNQYLANLLTQIVIGVSMTDKRFMMDDAHKVLKAHRAIIDACKKRDKVKAKELIYEHIMDSCENRIKVLRETK